MARECRQAGGQQVTLRVRPGGLQGCMCFSGREGGGWHLGNTALVCRGQRWRKEGEMYTSPES